MLDKTAAVLFGGSIRIKNRQDSGLRTPLFSDGIARKRLKQDIAPTFIFLSAQLNKEKQKQQCMFLNMMRSFQSIDNPISNLHCIGNDFQRGIDVRNRGKEPTIYLLFNDRSKIS